MDKNGYFIIETDTALEQSAARLSVIFESLPGSIPFAYSDIVGEF